MQLKLLSHLFHSLTILWEELFFLKADDNLGIYKVSPPGGGGGETICPPPMAVRSKNRGGSADLWWPAVAKLQAASVPIA